MVSFARAIMVAIVVAACAAEYPYPTYTVTTDKSELYMGDSVEASWTGKCSHKSMRCEDWISAYQVGACNGYDDTIGENTCFMKDTRYWLSFHGGPNDGSIDFEFDGPGTYSFRISHCGCGGCIPLIDNFAFCDSYQTYGESAWVTVLPPAGLNMSGWSHTEKFFAGFVFEMFEDSIGLLSVLMNSDCRNSLGNFSHHLLQAAEDLSQIFSGKHLMLHINRTMEDLQNVMYDVGPALMDCSADEIIARAVVRAVIKTALLMIDNLNVVLLPVKMAIKGYLIYSYVSNAILGWKLENHFASGLNVARMFNELISVSSIIGAAEVHVPALAKKATVPTAELTAAVKHIHVHVDQEGQVKASKHVGSVHRTAARSTGIRRVGDRFEECDLTKKTAKVTASGIKMSTKGCLDPAKVLEDYINAQ